MPKRQKYNNIPLEPENMSNVSNSQLKHYSKLGYKPYLSHGGKIKWLSFEQHTYETIKNTGKKNVFTFKSFKPKRYQPIRFTKILVKFIAYNWIFLLIITGVVVALLNLQNIIIFLAKI